MDNILNMFTRIREEGGLIHPYTVEFGGGEFINGGMTLRDYLAATAMGELMAKKDLDSEALAREAYKTADAMLAARRALDGGG